MTPAEISLAISGTTLGLSLVTTTAIVSYFIGRMKEDIEQLEKMMNHKADYADMVAIKESLAEIKGMFVLKLRELWNRCSQLPEYKASWYKRLHLVVVILAAQWPN